jgi:hypothetical protein
MLISNVRQLWRFETVSALRTMFFNINTISGAIGDDLNFNTQRQKSKNGQLAIDSLAFQPARYGA